MLPPGPARGEVGDHLVQPRADVCRALAGRHVGDQARECLLNEILGRLGASRRRERKAEQFALVSVVGGNDILGRIPRPVACEFDQLGLRSGIARRGKVGHLR